MLSRLFSFSFCSVVIEAAILTTDSSEICDGGLDGLGVWVGYSVMTSDRDLWCFPNCDSMDLMTSVILFSTASSLEFTFCSTD